MMPAAVEGRLGVALVEPRRQRLEPALEIAEHGLAVLDRIALLAVEQVGQHVETLLDALEDVVGVGPRPALGRACRQ